MVFYIASPTYQSIISAAIKESDLVLAGAESGSEIYINKYIKEHLNTFAGLDSIVIDFSCAMDLDNEIIDAMEMLKVMYGHLRIIVLAPLLAPGTDILVRCVNMAVYDIICSSDFGEIKEELKTCLLTGKNYRDALRYKNASADAGDGQAETKGQSKGTMGNKKAPNRVMLGFAGSQPRIGVTHNAIVAANTLRRRGYMVAILEMSQHRVFQDIMEFFEERPQEGGYFTLNGIDFYPSAAAEDINIIMAKAYNFLVIDFGSFDGTDLILYNKCDVPVLVAGSKPWELDAVNSLFGLNVHENLARYSFVFNFTAEKYREDIKSGMNELKKVYFAPMSIDAFGAVEDSFIEQICGIYLEEHTEKRKGIFGWKRKK